MTLESVDKLRKCAKETDYGCWEDDFNAIADEIEREVAERYVAWPLDADGEVVHVGDKVHNERWMGGREVCEIGFTFNGGARIYDDEGDWALPGDCRHRKPHTVEGLLRELDDFAAWHGAGIADLSAFAERIREAVRADG